MYYIVGLGNPGEEYKNTRHNIAWLVLDQWLTTCGLPTRYASSALSGSATEGVVYGHEVTVLYPNTYMNKSGSAVRKLVPEGEIAQLIVLYDDVDLAFGDVKVSQSRGAGGHNGVQSIIDSLGSKDFIRVRIGISPTGWFSDAPKRPGGDRLPRFVLGTLTTREQKQLPLVTEQVAHALRLILTDGVTAAMNKLN